MLSYALDVWCVSWITAASKAQRWLLAVPEDTSLQNKEKKKEKKKKDVQKSLSSLRLIRKRLRLVKCARVCVREASRRSCRQLGLRTFNFTAGQLARRLQEDYNVRL